MTTTFELHADELDGNFVKALKTLFKNRNLKITVDAEMDTTEYLLSNPANRQALEESIEQAKRGEVIYFTVEELQNLYHEENRVHS
jgi:hypothetical protein